MIYTDSMWIILVFFISFSASALEPFERLNKVRVVRVLPDNIVMLDRGLEDGIMKNDHIKLSQEEGGYSARGICVRATATNSYWKLYRIPYSEAISRDLFYSIVGMADKYIPEDIDTLRDQNIAINDQEDKKKKDENPFAVKADLPETLTERDLIDEVGPEKKKLLIEQAVNRDQLQRDLKDYKVSVYASPFTRQSINDGESLRYGIRGGNVASKYRLLTQYEHQQSKMTDPLTKEKVATQTTNGQAQFIIHRLTPNKSTLSLINYNSTSFSELGTPRSHWQVGPMGFTWHLFENKNWEYFDLSYIPLYDVRTTDIIDETGKRSQEKKNGLRHGFRGALRTKINERVSVENLLWVRPFQDISSWALEMDNLNLTNDLKFVFSLTEALFFDYNFIYQKDKLWKTLNGLPEQNIINSLNLRYDFDL